MENTSSRIHKQYNAFLSENILWFAASETCPPKEIMQYLSKIQYFVHRCPSHCELFARDRYTIHARICDGFQCFFQWILSLLGKYKLKTRRQWLFIV